MAVFRRLVCAAVCAGLLSGLVAAIAHQLGTVPLILEAEVYERAVRHEATQVDAHPTAADESKPESKIERAAYTLVADLLTATGFALLLAAGFTLRGGAITWRD